jgi:hypothetical protein
MAHVPPLEAILDCLAVELEPFAICKVARGWRLRMGAAPSATFHFVLAGQGRLRVGSDFSGSIGSRCLCIVPPGVGHALESGEHIVREATAETVLDRAGDLLRFVAGGDDGLTVACGRAEARYSGGLRLFDMLRAPVLIDFSDSPQMQALFEQILEEERGQGGRLEGDRGSIDERVSRAVAPASAGRSGVSAALACLAPRPSDGASARSRRRGARGSLQRRVARREGVHEPLGFQPAVQGAFRYRATRLRQRSSLAEGIRAAADDRTNRRRCRPQRRLLEPQSFLARLQREIRRTARKLPRIIEWIDACRRAGCVRTERRRVRRGRDGQPPNRSSIDRLIDDWPRSTYTSKRS